MKMQNNAEVKASSPIRTSLYEREGSMWGSLKRPSPRPTLFEECRSAEIDLADFLFTECHNSLRKVPLFNPNRATIYVLMYFCLKIIFMINYYDKNRFISKRELARLADVSPRSPQLLPPQGPHPLRLEIGTGLPQITR